MSGRPSAGGGGGAARGRGDTPAVPTPTEFAGGDPPLIPTVPVDRCPLCGRSEFDGYAEGFDYELATCGNRWRFVECRICRHVWLNPRPADGSLATIYPSHYYAYNFAERVHPIAVRGKAWLDHRRMAAIVARCGGPVRRYLDVGCGDGRFLKAMERAGVPREGLLGLELDRSVADRLAAQGYRVDCARVEDSPIADSGTLDLITMFHVVEHIDRPREAVAKLADWLVPGGLLALETPNRESLDARLFRRTFWGGYHIPRHWQLFSTEGVRRLLTEAGLDVILVSYQTGHSFWLYSIHHWLRFGPLRTRWLAKRFDPIGALVPLVAATVFDKVRAALGARTSAVLVIGRKPAHGLPAKRGGVSE